MTVRKTPAKNPEIDVPVNLPNEPVVEYGSDILTQLLADMGFDYVFINPGSSFRGLHDSLVNFGANKAPKVILTTHEGIAVSMAHGYAKASGKISVCILHNLVGLMQGSMGIYNAWADRTPILILGGSGPADPAERRFIDWAHSANSQGELVRPFTKWQDEPITLKATCDSMLRAKKIAETAPMGPTYVSIDSIIQETPAATDSPHHPIHSGYDIAKPSAANPATLKDAAEALIRSKQPLIFAGRIGLDEKVTEPLVELVEFLGAAYLDDRNIVCFPTSHPQNLNGDGLITAEADVLVTFECQDVSNLIGSYNTGRTNIQSADMKGTNALLINVSLDEYVDISWSRFGGPVAPIGIQVTADPIFVLHQLLELVKELGQDNKDFLKAAATRRNKLAGRCEAVKAKRQETAAEKWESSPISLARLNHEVYQAVKDEPWIMTVRNHRSHADGFWDYPGAGFYLGGDGGGGVGYGPGAAAGAALALKGSGKLPVAIIGDGDFLMSSGALWTAVHHQAPLLIVIIDNHSWGNDEHHQIEVAGQRNRPPENAHIGLHMRDPDIDLLSIAKGYGAWVEQIVEDPTDLADALANAVEATKNGEVAVVQVITSI